jgi:hypothetical protein
MYTGKNVINIVVFYTRINILKYRPQHHDSYGTAFFVEVQCQNVKIKIVGIKMQTSTCALPYPNFMWLSLNPCRVHSGVDVMITNFRRF